MQKLVSKHREGARVHRVFDRAQTSYQRLCASGVLTAGPELETLYQSLNPLQLRRELDTALDRYGRWLRPIRSVHAIPR